MGQSEEAGNLNAHYLANSLVPSSWMAVSDSTNKARPCGCTNITPGYRRGQATRIPSTKPAKLAITSYRTATKDIELSEAVSQSMMIKHNNLTSMSI